MFLTCSCTGLVAEADFLESVRRAAYQAGRTLQLLRIGGAGDTAEINATVYLVDSETGQVKASTKVVGKAGRKGASVGYSGSLLGGLGGDLAGVKNDNVGKAVEAAKDAVKK